MIGSIGQTGQPAGPNIPVSRDAVAEQDGLRIGDPRRCDIDDLVVERTAIAVDRGHIGELRVCVGAL